MMASLITLSQGNAINTHDQIGKNVKENQKSDFCSVDSFFFEKTKFTREIL